MGPHYRIPSIERLEEISEMLLSKTPLTLEAWNRLRAEIKRDDRNAEPEVLGPPEAFPDLIGTAEDRAGMTDIAPEAETGPHSRAVSWRITRSCAGWPEPPTPEEFFDAVRSATPTDRHAAIVGMWAKEAKLDEILEACLEGAYSLRQLIAAVHRTGNAAHPMLNQYLNHLMM